MLVNDGENDSEHASMQAITARTKTLKEDTIGPDPPMARIGAGFLGGICWQEKRYYGVVRSQVVVSPFVLDDDRGDADDLISWYAEGECGTIHFELTLDSRQSWRDHTISMLRLMTKFVAHHLSCVVLSSYPVPAEVKRRSKRDVSRKSLVLCAVWSSFSLQASFSGFSDDLFWYLLLTSVQSWKFLQFVLKYMAH